LAEANALLFSLHRVAQALPASLDLGEVLDSTMARLHDLFDAEVITIILRDDTTSTWVTAACDGMKLDNVLGDAALPAPLIKAHHAPASVVVSDLLRVGGPGLGITSRSGLYGALRARGALVGLVALEHRDPAHYGTREQHLLEGLVEPAALAIDNARWFDRLRT